VETLYARIKARARRTEKCEDWSDLVTRRGFSRSAFKTAVESLKGLPDRTRLRLKLLDKLSQDWRNSKTAKVTAAMTQCAMEKVMFGESSRWAISPATVAAVCESAEHQDWTDKQRFEAVCAQLVLFLPELRIEEINALAIYEITEWDLSQILV
jgi:hypothetical protein